VIDIRGDVIIFEGEQAARISSRLYPTQRDRFEEALKADRIDDNEKDANEAEAVAASEGKLDVLIDRAKGLAQAGMIEIGDLEQIVKELKETCE
jgi:hypothetical protein